VWGLLVAMGILAGAWAGAWMAKKRGQNPKIIWDLVTWVIVGAFVVARLFHVIYEPAIYVADPFEFFKIWHGGLSVIGGFIGATMAGVWFLKRKKVDVWAYADSALFGLPLGLFIGRMGCFLIHDHPGTLTDFVLGVKYPDGVRHDHGLYLSINGLILFLLFLWLARKNAKIGTYIIVFLGWYGVVRFYLDFFRATDGSIVDTRYLGLTPAQYGSILMVLLGGWLWCKWSLLSKKN
jgi:phosphatidylglycerol---prolipoprotein diacylglyceryl transferase